VPHQVRDRAEVAGSDRRSLDPYDLDTGFGQGTVAGFVDVRCGSMLDAVDFDDDWGSPGRCQQEVGTPLIGWISRERSERRLWVDPTCDLRTASS